VPKSNPNHRNCWHARRCAPLRSELPCPANVRSSAKGDTRSSTDHVCCACTTGHSTIYETRTSALAKANGRNRPLADVATLGKQTFNVRNKMREPTCQSYAGLLGCWVAGLDTEAPGLASMFTGLLAVGSRRLSIDCTQRLDLVYCVTRSLNLALAKLVKRTCHFCHHDDMNRSS
jgi:hypothetical protein